MPVTVIVGGQFGSEGKGKVSHIFARDLHANAVVRVGGSNSGHTVCDDLGNVHVFRHLPTAAVLSGPTCVLGPGCLIDPEVLREEVERSGLAPERLIIDPNAYVVTVDHRRREEELRLGKRIGSTLSGTGEAMVDRVRRLSNENLARNHPYLAQFTSRGASRTVLRERLDRNERILIEGTQGFGLSNLQSSYYPKVTSRDTTAATFVAEAGISPLDVDDVVLVIRAFPIRVAGDSGHLPLEIDWATVAREGAWHERLEERTSVTNHIRRVARFDVEIVRSAIDANAPTQIVLNHLDYFDGRCNGRQSISSRIAASLAEIEYSLERRVDWIGLGSDSLVKRSKVLMSHVTGNYDECA